MIFFFKKLKTYNSAFLKTAIKRLEKPDIQ
jgi:hypothetical protein